MPDELTPSTNIEKFLAKTAGESVELPEPATRIEKYLNKIASEQTITEAIDNWLDEHIDPSTGYVLDSTLTMNNAAPPASAVGDLKSAVVNQTVMFSTVANSYVDLDGTIKSYNGWKRTDYIKCDQGEELVIYTTVQSAYNAFYSAEGTPIAGTPSFKLSAGWNSITVPNSANYYMLSNTNSGIDNTVIKQSFVGKIERNTAETEFHNILFNGEEYEIEPEFAYGSVNSSYVDTYTTQYYRSKLIEAYTNTVVVHLPSTLAVFIVEYKTDKTGNYYYDQAVAPDSNGVAKFTLKEGSRYFKVVIRKINMQNIAPEDIEDVRVCLYSTLNDSVDRVESIANTVDYSTIEGIAVHPYSAKLSQAFEHKVSDLNIKPFVLLHFSDIHGYEPNLYRLIDWEQNQKILIPDDVICTGDMVSGNFTHPDILNSATGAKKYLQIIGNHDAYNTNAENLATSKQCYDKYFAPNISEWDVIQPQNAESNGLCYYYKDYQEKESRLICIDAIHFDSNQLTWLANTLNDAKTNDLNVVIASHYYSATGVTPIECSYTSDIELTASDFETLPESAYSAVDDFINSGGKFVCWIVGHSHFDYLGTPVNHSNQLLVFVESAGLPYDSSRDARIAGTASQDSFNIIGFDTVYGLIKIVRIGSNVNKFMQSKAMLCYDYVNKQLLSCE